MAEGLISLKVTIPVDIIDNVINDYKQTIKDGLYDVVEYAKNTVAAYTPYDPVHKNGGPHLNNPTLRQYDNGTVSLQWRANNQGFYYADIQNSDWSLNHRAGERAGFIDDAQEIVKENAPGFIAERMGQRGY